MQQNEKFKDWLFRYQSFYRVRRTDKSKRRFISALVADISDMREDVQVIEYNRHKKYASRNVYVGDIEKADRDRNFVRIMTRQSNILVLMFCLIARHRKNGQPVSS